MSDFPSHPYPWQLQEWQQLNQQITAKKLPHALMFAGAKGAVLRVSTFRPRVFAPAVARCQTIDRDFPSVTPHDLRHTAASLAISAGANVKAVQTMLGHKSAAMTLDTYSDLFPDDLDAVAARLDEAVRAEGVGISCLRGSRTGGQLPYTTL